VVVVVAVREEGRGMTDCRRAATRTMFEGRNGAQLQRPGAPRGAAPDIPDIRDTRLSGGVATGKIDPVQIEG
jgi:hypothetical protein